MDKLQAEWIKTKRTSLVFLLIFTAFLSNFLSYLLNRQYFVQMSLNTFYEFIYPLFLLLAVLHIFSTSERKNKNMIVVLGSSNLGETYLAKFIVSCIYGFLGIVVYILFLSLGSFLGGVPLDYGQVFLGMGLLWISGIFLISMEAFLCQWIPPFLSFGVLFLANTLSSVFYDKWPIWYMNPFATPSVLMIDALKILPNGLSYSQSSPFSSFMEKGWALGISLFLFLIFYFLGRESYKKKEGNI